MPCILSAIEAVGASSPILYLLSLPVLLEAAGSLLLSLALTAPSILHPFTGLFSSSLHQDKLLFLFLKAFSLFSLWCQLPARCPPAAGSVHVGGSRPSAQAPHSFPPCFRHSFLSSALSCSAGPRACFKSRKMQ